MFQPDKEAQMKSIKLTSIVLLGMIALFTQINAAQAKVRGTFTKTCVGTVDPVAGNDSLRAICETMGGNWVSTQLNQVSSCQGDIWNYDGRLMCNPGVGGSYLRTCGGAVFNRRQNSLSADCRRKDGAFHRTELGAVTFCKGEVSNDDGNLVCPR